MCKKLNRTHKEKETGSELTLAKTSRGLLLRAKLFEGRLALNPGLNLTRVCFSCVEKHVLG